MPAPSLSRKDKVMSTFIDISNKKFNRWTILNFAGLDRRGEAQWLCRCQCGTEKIVLGGTLRNGKSKGCSICRNKRKPKGSHYILVGNDALFQSNDGIHFLVSIQNAALISRYTWCLAKDGYLVTRINKVLYKLHHMIMGKKLDVVVDHINGNKLDNRRCNLRIADYSQNACNSNIRKHNTSGFKGVCWNKAIGKWQGNIQFRGKSHHLGVYGTKDAAALAYNVAAKKNHGRYACINPIGETEGYRTINRGESR